MIVIYILGYIVLGLISIYLILLIMGLYLLKKGPLPFDEKENPNTNERIGIIKEPLGVDTGHYQVLVIC